MNEQAREDGDLGRQHAAGQTRLSRRTLTIVLALVGVAILLAGNIAAPYLVAGATLEGAFADQLRATSGLRFHTHISGRFDLLPRPHLVFYDTKITDPAGAIELEAEELDGDVRLLPLVVGRIELSSVTLVRPKLTIDLDGQPIAADSFIGRALRTGERDPDKALGILALVEGATTIKSKSLRRPVELTDVNVTLDWRDLGSAATLTGTLSLEKTTADVAAWIARPAGLMRGSHSAVALHLHSMPLDFSATGNLVSTTTTAFSGHVSASAPSMTALLGIVGRRDVLLAPFANFSMNGDASLGIDTDKETSVDLQNLTLRADGNAYEGSLSFQGGTRPALSGTLASEQLSLAPFLSRLPALRDPNGTWSSTKLVGAEPPTFDLDLRVSANHIRLAPFTIDDAALAVMTRRDRTEVALVEGKAYGGTTKGRISVGIRQDDVSVRGAGSLTAADSSALTWDGFGRQLASGNVSASASFETNGDNVATLVRNLQGWAKGSATDGELVGADFARALRERRRGTSVDALKAVRGGRTAFQTLAFAARATDGIATLDEGAIKMATGSIATSGTADLGARELDLQVLGTPLAPADPGSKAPPPLAFRARGPIDRVMVYPESENVRP